MKSLKTFLGICLATAGLGGAIAVGAVSAQNTSLERVDAGGGHPGSIIIQKNDNDMKYTGSKLVAYFYDSNSHSAWGDAVSNDGKKYPSPVGANGRLGDLSYGSYRDITLFTNQYLNVYLQRIFFDNETEFILAKCIREDCGSSPSSHRTYPCPSVSRMTCMPPCRRMHRRGTVSPNPPARTDR